ncbi:universal stress protein [Clostridium estertheticum]|uniref:universal stress protein n=1 Tax=Clostridium estertheticum TaxID=238834 RepID=UPI001C0BBC2D|nr:universal stress protein [Clostridium estertheticum]MBU3175546.1 universal stress protein [Clostridium estertheticum]
MEAYEKETRGKLKIYIGGAPGVGKSYQMLHDANDMKKSNIDIIIGIIETYGRVGTEEQIGHLEILPLKEIKYKGINLKELDIDGVIARKPEFVIIDELAHTNVPTSRNKKRFEDVLEILDNGINVMTAVNIQHLESLNDHVSRMTGIKVKETLPDKIIDIADEIEVVDVSPDALRGRIQDGKVYSEDKIEDALHNFFRIGNLTALRELTLREVANEVDEKLVIYKNKKKVAGLIGAQEKILVCVNLNFNAEYLIRRGYRMAKMLKAEFYVLTVSKPYNHEIEESKKLEELKKLCEKLDVELKVERSKHRERHIIEFATCNNITQIIIGPSARTRFHEILRGSIVRTIMRDTKYIDVLVVADPVH